MRSSTIIKNGCMNRPTNTLTTLRMGFNSHQEAVVYMRDDCHVCSSEGFAPQSRVQVSVGEHNAIATLCIVSTDVASGVLLDGQAGLSEVCWRRLGFPDDGSPVEFSHAPSVDSLSSVRAKLYGESLDEPAYHAILGDIVAGRYSDIHLAAFLSAGAGGRMSDEETVALTRAMIDVGARLEWPTTPVVDKHCIGGLPGNRTTPIVVAIAAAAGLTMPKTSSRAITSPAGTADTMETLAPVDLTIDQIREVVRKEGGCVAWGGSVRLSPADDVLIRVERALDIDSTSQLVASVLSKKAAAGSTHVVIDIPVGPTAKVRTVAAAEELERLMITVAQQVGLTLRVVRTDGTQPVGRGIGPALEARDVLAVLRNDPEAPADLRQRAVALAGALLELAGAEGPGDGEAAAAAIVADGRAWQKFVAICEAQGGVRTPPQAAHKRAVMSARSGVVTAIDNRRLARVAKLAGAPDAPAAGLEFLAPVGTELRTGQPLFVLHTQTPGELEYAMAYVEAHPDIIEISDL